MNDLNLVRFLNVINGVLDKYYSPDCCIVATKITCEIFKKLHYKVKPLSVTVDIFNPPMREYIVRTYKLPSKEEMEEMKGYYVILGSRGEAKPGKWPGHLVAILNDGISKPKYLIDTTLQQSSRPNHGINLTPIVTELALEANSHCITLDNSAVQYTFYPNDKSFYKSKNWQNPVDDIVKEVWRLM